MKRVLFIILYNMAQNIPTTLSRNIDSPLWNITIPWWNYQIIALHKIKTSSKKELPSSFLFAVVLDFTTNSYINKRSIFFINSKKTALQNILLLMSWDHYFVIRGCLSTLRLWYMVELIEDWQFCNSYSIEGAQERKKMILLIKAESYRPITMTLVYIQMIVLLILLSNKLIFLLQEAIILTKLLTQHNKICHTYADTPCKWKEFIVHMDILHKCSLGINS